MAHMGGGKCVVFQDINTIVLYVFINVMNYCLKVWTPQINGADNTENLMNRNISM